MRTGWPPHVVAGLTEADYAASGLAAEVWTVTAQVLYAQDKKQARAKPRKG